MGQIEDVAFFNKLVVAAKSSLENLKKNTSLHSNLTANKGLCFFNYFNKSHLHSTQRSYPGLNQGTKQHGIEHHMPLLIPKPP